MSHQPAVGTKPQVKKAGSKHDENRDSTHPKMVTELFVGFLSAIGEAVKVTPLFKDTREEVMWSDALLPWRRSPLWMLLRVSMQLVFSRWQDIHELLAEYYKTFIVFLMGEVLQLSLGHNIPSDLLYAMNAKLGRRLLKLDPSVPRAGLPVVHGVMHRAAGLICTRWKEIQNQASPFYDLSTLESLDFDHDAVAGLDSLAELVDSPSSGAPGTAAACFRPTSLLIKFPPEVLPACPRPSGEYAYYELKAFEAWVASGLSRWGKSHEGDDSTCAKISALIMTYYQTASPLYAGDPESLSVLLLTVIELWIVCDRSALHLCGLLKDYDPGIPHHMLQSLVLPSKSQMERLLRAEDYLRDRRTRAVHACPFVFREYGRATCFGVRYFDVSAEHQRLRQDNERHAAQTKLEKVNELRRKRDEYNALMKFHDQASCQFIDVIVDHEYDVRERQHSRACRKCDYRSRAASIAIHVHEWPLPNNSLEAKSTIFELKLHPFFAQWRDTAFFLLTEVFNAESQVAHRPRANHPQRSYQGLSSYFTAAFSEQRLVLLSEVKPHGITHRRARAIGVTDESDICVNNGLRYRYYDDARASALQKFLFRPPTNPDGLPPNTVIASQWECPEHMSLEEFKALCNISLGHRIQWQNVLLQLSAPSVDFKKVETALVILQSICQAGPFLDGSILISSHEVVGDGRSADALLRSLDENLQQVRENWESSQALGTFISDVKTRCLTYLRNARAVTFGWLNLLTGKAYNASDDSHRASLNAHAAELALICVDSFNLDDRRLHEVLCSPNDGYIFIRCCILIQEAASAIASTSHPTALLWHRRWKSLCHRSYPLLAREILDNHSRSLDDAIKESWSAYVASDGWSTVSQELDYWMVNSSRPDWNSKSLVIHYNLSTGELLVDGLPLARLPREYFDHPLYHTLFGCSNLEVMPTTVADMRFSAKRDHAGHTIHLGVRLISNAVISSNSISGFER
ncbi:hypothetical protein LTR92_011357 [Exophiala xenobiotica]|nr:hypothetical protein LTR92_011357 [Exophiala xenobiotica]